MQPINDLKARIAAFRPSIQQAADRVLDRGWVVLGPEVSIFEAAFAGYVGANSCITVANGTDALEIGLRALGVGAGDYVATVANAGRYASTAIAAIGATPYYVDVDETTQVLTFREVTRAIDAGVRHVVATHLFGLALPDIEAIATLCRGRGVSLLEDCAQAHGARINGRMVGSFGDIGAFSFYPTKNLGALGDGGALTTSDEKLAVRVGSLRQYGWTSKYRVETAHARNSRLDELQAAFLNEFLPCLDSANEQRRKIAEIYVRGIARPEISLPPLPGESYVAHLFVIRCEMRDSLREYLHRNGIQSEIHYPIPDHRQPVNGDAFGSVLLPITERLANTVLTLPCYPELSIGAAEKVVATVNGWSP